MAGKKKNGGTSDPVTSDTLQDTPQDTPQEETDTQNTEETTPEPTQPAAEPTQTEKIRHLLTVYHRILPEPFRIEMEKILEG